MCRLLILCYVLANFVHISEGNLALQLNHVIKCDFIFAPNNLALDISGWRGPLSSYF